MAVSGSDTIKHYTKRKGPPRFKKLRRAFFVGENNALRITCLYLNIQSADV
jgi:hypothetical protein